MLEAVGWQFVKIAGKQQSVDQVGDFDGTSQFAKFIIEELNIELGIVADDNRVF